MTDSPQPADRNEIRWLVIALCASLLALAALAGYLFYLKRQAQAQWRNRPHFAATSPPAAATADAEVALLLPDETTGRFVTKKAPISAPADPSRRMLLELRTLFAELRSRALIPEDADVLAVFALSDDAAVVDLNSAFSTSSPPDREKERLMIQAMTQTLAANHPALRRVKFLLDGAEREPLPGQLDLRVWFLPTRNTNNE